MLKAIFNEAEAQVDLTILNIEMARIFVTEPKAIRFVFLNYIASPRKGKVSLGLCLHESNEIQIRLGPGWQNTAVHELVHLYNPGCSEKKTVKIVNDVIRYLKGAMQC